MELFIVATAQVKVGLPCWMITITAIVCKDSLLLQRCAGEVLSMWSGLNDLSSKDHLMVILIKYEDFQGWVITIYF